MVTIFPPSPALSVCDSLDGIDDLDAFLASQGNLSHFPTPPLKKATVIVQTEEISDSSSECSVGGDSMDYSSIACLLCRAASIEVDYNVDDAQAIWMCFGRRNIPRQFLAMAFNILVAIRHRQLPMGSLENISPALIVTAALGLAMTYLDDRPPPPSWWASKFSAATWSRHSIASTTAKLLHLLDWKMHSLTAPPAMDQALLVLQGISTLESRSVSSTPAATDSEGPTLSPEDVVQRPLDLSTIGTSARWEHGQLTPESTTPPPSRYPKAEPKHGAGLFLPLL